jgi:hypothetical protein
MKRNVVLVIKYKCHKERTRISITLKSAVFWNVMQCSPTFWRNVGVVSQKIVMFVVSAVSTSNPTLFQCFQTVVHNCRWAVGSNSLGHGLWVKVKAAP